MKISSSFWGNELQQIDQRGAPAAGRIRDRASRAKVSIATVILIGRIHRVGGVGAETVDRHRPIDQPARSWMYGWYRSLSVQPVIEVRQQGQPG